MTYVLISILVGCCRETDNVVIVVYLWYERNNYKKVAQSQPRAAIFDVHYPSASYGLLYLAFTLLYYACDCMHYPIDLKCPAHVCLGSRYSSCNTINMVCIDPSMAAYLFRMVIHHTFFIQPNIWNRNMRWVMVVVSSRLCYDYIYYHDSISIDFMEDTSVDQSFTALSPLSLIFLWMFLPCFSGQQHKQNPWQQSGYNSTKQRYWFVISRMPFVEVSEMVCIVMCVDSFSNQNSEPWSKSKCYNAGKLLWRFVRTVEQTGKVTEMGLFSPSSLYIRHSQALSLSLSLCVCVCCACPILTCTTHIFDFHHLQIVWCSPKWWYQGPIHS